MCLNQTRCEAPSVMFVKLYCVYRDYYSLQFLHNKSRRADSVVRGSRIPESSAAFRLQFCQGSEVTDECVTGEGGTCQQLCPKNRCNHGDAVWTCQLTKSGDAPFPLRRRYGSSSRVSRGTRRNNNTRCSTTETMSLRSVHALNVNHMSESSSRALLLTISGSGHWISLINVLESSNIYDHPLYGQSILEPLGLH